MQAKRVDNEKHPYERDEGIRLEPRRLNPEECSVDQYLPASAITSFRRRGTVDSGEARLTMSLRSGQGRADQRMLKPTMQRGGIRRMASSPEAAIELCCRLWGQPAVGPPACCMLSHCSAP